MLKKDFQMVHFLLYLPLITGYEFCLAVSSAEWFRSETRVLAVSDDKGFVPKMLYRIGEVMRYSGLSRQMIHNYTMMRLIREVERTEAGHRLYGEEVFEQLARIQELKRTKTLREIQDVLLEEPPVGSSRRKSANHKSEPS